MASAGGAGVEGRCSLACQVSSEGSEDSTNIEQGVSLLLLFLFFFCGWVIPFSLLGEEASFAPLPGLAQRRGCQEWEPISPGLCVPWLVMISSGSLSKRPFVWFPVAGLSRGLKIV